VRSRPSWPTILADRSHSRPSEEVAFSVEEAFERGGSFKFIVENIFANAPVDVGLPNAPPIGRDLTIEFYTVPQGLSPGPADPALLIASRRVPPSGRVEVELPAEVPLFELLRTQDGEIAQGRDGQVYHVGGQNFGHAGVEARCVGCHAGHSTQKVPEDPRFTNIAPGADLATTTSRRNKTNSTWFHPNNLVDRDTTPRVGDWAGDLPAKVELSWPDRVVARELVLYAPRQDDPEIRNPLRLEGALLRFFAGTGEEVHRVELEQPIEPTGTRVPLDENIAFRRVRVSLARDQVSGVYPTLSSQVAAIAEIEITGRSIEPPFRFFTRGDVDCNQTIDVTDALQMFSGLLTDMTLCCESAADLDRNQILNINDPMVLLNHLFLNSPPPPGPFPLCGKGHSALNCAKEMCK